MKNYLIFFISGLLYFISGGCSSSVGQQDIPGDILKKADEFVISRTGEEYFTKYFKYDPEKSLTDSPYIQIIYSFNIPEKPFIDETIQIISDFQGNIEKEISEKGIPECMMDSSLCSFIINEEDAFRIAEENGLERGIKDWKSDFKWESKYKKYVWVVTNIISGTEGSHGFRGKGEQVIIDPASGNVIDKSEWFVR